MTFFDILQRSKARRKMNAICNSKGKTINIKGEDRTVIDVRLCYGNSLSLTLDKPLTGTTSGLFTVDVDSVWFIIIPGYVDNRCS